MEINDVMMYNKSMHRTQVLLKDRQYAALKAWSGRLDKSLGELIRLAVDRMLGAQAPAGRGSRLKTIRAIAADHGGAPGRDHDRLLYGDSR